MVDFTSFRSRAIARVCASLRRVIRASRCVRVADQLGHTEDGSPRFDVSPSMLLLLLLLVICWLMYFHVSTTAAAGKSGPRRAGIGDRRIAAKQDIYGSRKQTVRILCASRAAASSVSGEAIGATASGCRAQPTASAAAASLLGVSDVPLEEVRERRKDNTYNRLISM